MKNYLLTNKKFLIIILGMIALNWYYGFDARFTIINALWLLINLVKL